MNVSELYHHGVKGQKWGVRRYQNYDGTLTDLGRKRVRVSSALKTKDAVEDIVRKMSDVDLKMLNQDRNKEYMSVKEGEWLVKRFTKKENGKPVAFLDLIDGYGDLINISLGTDPDHRGKGYAKKLTKQATKWFDKQDTYKTLSWSARKDNKASNKVAKDSGFKKNYYYSNTDPEWNVYEIKKKEQKQNEQF